MSRRPDLFIRIRIRIRIMSSSTTQQKFNLIDLQTYWNRFKDSDFESDWRPQLYCCGPYNNNIKAFPVRLYDKHILYIPASDKPLFRFLNHMLYCCWTISLSERVGDFSRKGFQRVARYLDLLRSEFFQEVLQEFYPPNTKLPAHVPTVTNQLRRDWKSDILWSWIFQTHATGGRLVPADHIQLNELKNNPFPEGFGECI